MSAPAPLLRIDQIEVAYHRVITALQGVSVDVHAGTIVAILGTNGAGKTTTLRAVSGFIGLDDARVTSGRIVFEGEAIENQPPHRITTRGIVLVPERDKVFPNLTVAENLEATVTRPGSDRRGLIDAVWELFPALTRLKRRTAGLLSGGERQMLAIGSALVCGPRLLLVDELSQGLAPRIVDDIAERLRQVRDRMGVSVLLGEQNAELALSMADHGYSWRTVALYWTARPRVCVSMPTYRSFIWAARANDAAIARSNSIGAAAGGSDDAVSCASG